MFTTEGGVEIEQVAAETPERSRALHVDPLVGFEPDQARELLARRIGDAGERRQIAEIVEKLYALLRRGGRDALRDQPADRHAGGRASARSTPS